MSKHRKAHRVRESVDIAKSVDTRIEEMIQNGELIKRMADIGALKPTAVAPRSMFYDPMSLMEQLDYKEKYSSVTFDILNTMAERTEVVNAIINTRCAQIGSFGQPARWKKNSLGYRIRFKDANKEPTKSEQERLNTLEEIIYQTGYTDIYRSGERRPNFSEFLRRETRDSLVLDNACFEMVPNLAGEVCEFWPVDGATIRLARTPEMVPNVDDGRDIIKYVQIYNGQVRHQFSFRELAFCPRNVRNQIKHSGYGYSELEMLIAIITGILYAEEYNRRFFSTTSTINGVLNLKGTNLSQDMVEAFRRQWRSMLEGEAGAHRIPVTFVKDGIEFVPMHANNRDMEWSAWLEFLVKMATAVYLIDPAEVNFDYRGASESAPLFETSPEAKLKHSRDKGLRNLLNFFEEKINFHIIQPYDPHLFLEFVGIDMKDTQELVNIAASEVQAYKKVNEVRKDMGIPPISAEEGGELVLNNTLINWQMQQQQQQQEAATQMAGGQGGAPGGGQQGNGAGAPPMNIEDMIQPAQQQPPQRPMSSGGGTQGGRK